MQYERARAIQQIFGRIISHPQLLYNLVCKRDMKALDIDVEFWESLAADRTRWRGQHPKTGEEKLLNAAADKRARRKERSNFNKPETTHTQM